MLAIGATAIGCHKDDYNHPSPSTGGGDEMMYDHAANIREVEKGATFDSNKRFVYYIFSKDKIVHVDSIYLVVMSEDKSFGVSLITDDFILMSSAKAVRYDQGIKYDGYFTTYRSRLPVTEYHIRSSDIGIYSYTSIVTTTKQRVTIPKKTRLVHIPLSSVWQP